MSEISRRRILTTGSALLGVALAGCGGDGGGDETTAEETATETAAEEAAEYDGWLEDAATFDGSVADRTGESEVTVEVGAQGNGGAFAFAPPAVRVSTGTTVRWEWTGEGSNHNVAAQEGASFESETVMEAGHTFSQTLEDPGVVKYQCTPHVSLGMKGVVEVVEG